MPTTGNAVKQPVAVTDKVHSQQSAAAGSLVEKGLKFMRHIREGLTWNFCIFKSYCGGGFFFLLLLLLGTENITDEWTICT